MSTPTPEAFEAAERAIWHHRGRAARALDLIAEILASLDPAEYGGDMIPEWEQQAREIAGDTIGNRIRAAHDHLHNAEWHRERGQTELEARERAQVDPKYLIYRPEADMGTE